MISIKIWVPFDLWKSSKDFLLFLDDFWNQFLKDFSETDFFKKKFQKYKHMLMIWQLAGQGQQKKKIMIFGGSCDLGAFFLCKKT